MCSCVRSVTALKCSVRFPAFTNASYLTIYWKDTHNIFVHKLICFRSKCLALRFEWHLAVLTWIRGQMKLFESMDNNVTFVSLSHCVFASNSVSVSTLSHFLLAYHLKSTLSSRNMFLSSVLCFSCSCVLKIIVHLRINPCDKEAGSEWNVWRTDIAKSEWHHK